MARFIGQITNLLLNQIERFWDIFWVKCCSLVMNLLCFFNGVSVGKKNRFYGLMKFKKGKANKIIIGNNCTFRSKSTSNLIGINRPCIFSSIGHEDSMLIIGDNCGFSGTVIGCFSKVILGNHVRCGANTLITDSDWHLDDYRSSIPKPVYINNNVWLGVNVIVLKGVTIGENSVIGAGSVVSKDIPANVVAAGNPCKVIRILS
jgi:acetyltransferase-like isoleucine patch superfamily enzyme